MWYVYLLYSPSKNRHYIGATNNLESRLEKHNSGKGAKSTRVAKDWILKHFKKFESKSEALSFEYTVKNNTNLRKDFYKKGTKLI